MATTTSPPDGWERTPARRLDRKYTTATPLVYEHTETDRTIQVVPTLIDVPGDETEWRVREVRNGTTLVVDGADERSAAVARAMEVMRGH